MYVLVSSKETVFSAHAEVVPSFGMLRNLTCRILRARGGSSLFMAGVDIDAMYSPRTRR